MKQNFSFPLMNYFDSLAYIYRIKALKALEGTKHIPYQFNTEKKKLVFWIPGVFKMQCFDRAFQCRLRRAALVYETMLPGPWHCTL